MLLAQRPRGKPYEGYWEFPGGKLEPGETPAHALARELHEELGLKVRRAAPWIVQEFVYPHAHVELNFFRVFDWDGEPHGHDGQAFAWQTPGAFDVSPLLPANTRVLAALKLPPIYGISCASDLGEDTFLARAEAAFARGLKLVQVREKDWPAARVADLALRVKQAARAHGAKVLLNGEADAALELGLDGVHWTSARLIAARSRPEDIARRCVLSRYARACARCVAPLRLRSHGTRATDAFACGSAAARLGWLRAPDRGHENSGLRAWRSLARGSGHGHRSRRAGPRDAARGVVTSSVLPRPAAPEDRRRRVPRRECDTTRSPMRRSRSACSAPSRTDAMSTPAPIRPAFGRWDSSRCEGRSRRRGLQTTKCQS